MPKPQFPKRDPAEWNTQPTRDNAAEVIRAWAAQPGEVTRLDAAVEFASLWRDLVGDQTHPISYKSLSYVLYSTILGEE